MMSIQVAGLFTCKLIHVFMLGFQKLLEQVMVILSLLLTFSFVALCFELCTQAPREWAVIISTNVFMVL